MHSGFEIPGIHRQETTCPAVHLPTNPTHILEQIHTLPASQQLVLLNQHHHFVPPQFAASPAYLPVNFKLGLSSSGEDALLLRGSEQYGAVPEARQSSLGMLHCWQNQQDSANKQTPFWEALPAEASNENSEIVDRHEHLERDQKHSTLTNCLDTKTRLHFGELEAIYKRLGTSESIQTCPSETVPVTAHLPAGQDHGSEAEAASASRKKRRRKKKKNSYNELISPTADFFGDLVKRVIDHQENLQTRFMEVVERLDDERRAREEAWRNQELAYFEREVAARAHEKALAKSREAMMVSYLEKISGETINFPRFDPTTENNDDDGVD